MAPDRAAQIQRFLTAAGWGGAQPSPLAGDASTRRYERLTLAGRSAVLMDAPGPDSLAAFVRIDRHLAACGLSAPHIVAADQAAGLILLEDLGDALFARVLAADPALETELYLAATDALLALRAHPAAPAPLYGAAEMAAAIDLAHDWYARGAAGTRIEAGKAAVRAALAAALAALPPWRPSLALRDYHAENLFWLTGRTGPARVGLIDFQDAVLSHPLYDLVSLLRDVRRSVAPATQQAALSHWAAATGEPPAALSQAAATLGAQRNLRILGIFVRLALADGKAQYVDLIPATWARLGEDLAHPALAALAEAVFDSLPAPTTDTLRSLKNRCGTIPMRS